MSEPRVRLRLLAVSLLLGVTACSAPVAPGATPPAPSGSSSAVVVPSAGASASAAPSAAASPVVVGAPKAALAVGVRTLKLSRGADRALPTTVWYPAAGKAGGSPRKDAAAAAGRFPIVLFSHGLRGLPAYYQQVTTRLAAAGFVVAAPAYPFTNRDASPFQGADVINQPADGSAVLTALLKLNTTAGDRFAGRLDGGRIAVAGHSAGGFTSAGMLANKRDDRVRAAVVIAGGALGGFRGSRTPVLFVHGDRDAVVKYETGRDAYDATSWPRAFLTVLGGGHSEFLAPGAKGFDPMMKTMTDFLRWTLYADAAAKGRLAKDGTRSGVSRFEAKL
ncbi:dienelactone hydrolase family protein [Catellatospora bangladeshensis]|uniref:alpha/beta hydrolase family protein n=1 Tax=Catellatospora bangladeshensis TaxID=310355 RepID=UPI001EF1EE94|nr:dienelactone hydrolase family protein [Catellatospora bangladeshensis]